MKTLRQKLTSFAFDQEREELCADAKRTLTKLVYEYYDVAAWEQDLIQDTVGVFKHSIIPSASRLPTLPTLKEASDTERRDYAEFLSRTLNNWAHRQPWKVSAEGRLDKKGGLCLLTLTRDEGRNPYQESEADGRFEKALERLAKAARKQHGRLTYLRGFYLVDGDSIHILKPLAYRHWTRTAALNDADVVWGALLRAGERRS